MMTAIANIKTASIIGGATEAEYDANKATHPFATTLSATVGVDVSTAGSPGQLSPSGFIPGTGIARWQDRSSGIAVGFPTFTLLVRPPTKESRLTKVQGKYVVPTLAVTSPATGSGIQPTPTKAYEMTFNFEFLIPEATTRLERILFYGRAVSLFLSRVVAADASPADSTGSPIGPAVIDGEQPY